MFAANTGQPSGTSGRLSQELKVFFELARVVAEGRYEVGETLERICSEVRAAFAFERAMLVRYDADARTVHAVVQQGVEWPGDQWLLLGKFPFLEQALSARRAVFVADPRGEQAMPNRVIERFGVGAVVAVPLCVSDRCLGFLVADRSGKSFRLGPDDLELLTAFGYLAAVFIDKTDQYAELARALDDLKRLDQLKSEFISIASHELRTPIAVVHGITSTLHLRGDELTGDQLRELRQALYDQSSRLVTLAEQLLDLSRIDTGAVSIEPCRFRPREHLDTLLPRLVPDRLGDIQLDVSPRLELFTDPHGFERIVANLILNALSHGRPPVEVTSEVNGGVLVVVQDHGEGVPAAFVPRLFERFSRGEETRGRAGAGLGLAIARSFALALGGDLAYEPAEPRGARFTLSLPREAMP